MLIILIYPLTIHWGILGASLTVLFAAIGANALAFYTVIKITKCGIYNFLRMVSLPLISSLVAMVFIFLLPLRWVTPNVLLIPFILSLLFYWLVYFGVIYLFDRFSTYKIQPLVKEVFLTLRGL